MAAPIEICLLMPAPMADQTVPASATVGYVRDKAREVLLANGCLDQGKIVHLLMATGRVVNGVPEKVELNTNEIPVVQLGTLNLYVVLEVFEVNPNQAAAFYTHSQ